MGLKFKVGDQAPNVKALDQSGSEVALKDFKGRKNVVLYFYPKDNTPGCTVQACGLRDEHEKIKKKDTIVLGVSPDSEKSHQKFIEKFELPFNLLVDEDKLICKTFGVWQKKKFMGNEFMGVVRTTFIIGKDGKIIKIFDKVKTKEHSQDVLEALKAI